MTTQLKLYNGALRLCEERRLRDLNEDRAPKRYLDDVWAEDPIRLWLAEGQWQFASRSYQLQPDPDVTPSFGYPYAFKKPDDYVRLIAISANEFLNPPLIDFRDESGYWYVHTDTIYVSIVSDAPEYGRDMARWPENFTRFAQADMAVEINPRLAGGKADQERLEKIRHKRLHDALGKDNVSRPVMFPARGTWVNARTGGLPSRSGRRG